VNSRRKKRQFESGVSPMKEVMTHLFEVGEFAHLYKNRDMCLVWSKVCPGQFIDDTRLRSFVRGVLTIEVSSSAVLQELSHFHKSEILMQINRLKQNRVKKIFFKLGQFDTGLQSN
jgi:hypothetical protein